ncbi:MAG: MFS transporter [Chloroflexi bacterium]|nr:MFS transporter [Chloroflexota bacterium]
MISEPVSSRRARRQGLLGNRNVTLIIVARLFMSASRSLAGVITPVYLALIGFSALQLGEMAVAVGIVSAVLSTAIGLTSDRTGRKPYLVVVPLFAVLAGLVFAVSRSPLVLVAAASIGSFGRGMGAGAGAVGPYQPAEQALVTETTPAARRNVAFGRLAFASSMGALVGGPVAALAGSGRAGGAAATAAFRAPFVVAAAFALIAGLLALGLVESPRPPIPAGSGPHPRLPHRSMPLLLRLWATNSVNGLAVGMFGPFVTYWFFRRYGVGPGQIGVLFAVINGATALSTLSAAGFARRWGLVRTVTVVRIVQAILIVPMVMAPSFVMAGAIYLVRMVVQRIGMPLRQSYVLAMADPGERAAVGALSNLPSQATMAVAPIAAGYVFDEVSLSLPFLIAGTLQFVNAVMYWGFFRNMPPEEEIAARATPRPET